jgi:flavodoxin
VKKTNKNVQRILVTYYSLSNNTQLLANTLRDYLSTEYDVAVSEIRHQSPSELDDYDLVLIGSPCHDSDLALPVKNFLKELPLNPSFKLAGFYCHATYKRNDSHPRAESMFDEWAAKGLNSFKEISIEKNIDLLGIFNCMGVPSQPIMEFIHREIIPDEKEWSQYRQESLLHPSQDDLDELVEFAERIMKET